LCDKIGVSGEAFALLDAVIKPAGRLNSAMEIFRETNFNAFRFYLVGKAFMLVNYEASILLYLFTEFLIN